MVCTKLTSRIIVNSLRVVLNVLCCSLILYDRLIKYLKINSVKICWRSNLEQKAVYCIKKSGRSIPELNTDH